MLFPLYWKHVSVPEDVVASTTSAAPGSAPAAVSIVQRREVTVWGPAYRVDSWHGDRRTRTIGVAPLFSRTYTGPRR